MTRSSQISSRRTDTTQKIYSYMAVMNGSMQLVICEESGAAHPGRMNLIAIVNAIGRCC